MLTMMTNSAEKVSTRSLNMASKNLSTAMQRLGTGKKINQASDDAAGLQIATRLQAQSQGIGVAKNNIAKATSLLQTGEGAFDSVNNILFRMKELAIQAADDSHSDDDRFALQDEFDALYAEVASIMGNTSYGNEPLFKNIVPPEIEGKFTQPVQFQIGHSTEEKLILELGPNLDAVVDSLIDLGGPPGSPGMLASVETANESIEYIDAALNNVTSFRSTLGANINRLGHTANNLNNMKDNTDINIGVIRDTDFAAEAAQLSRQSMLMQSSQAMLKRAGSMTQFVMGMIA